MRVVLFHRRFRKFHGGHLKIWHYFNHVKATVGFAPKIHFSPPSVCDNSNPWMDLQEDILPSFNTESADVLFLGGRDWLQIDRERRDVPERPVLNLIQNVRHARPEKPHYEFLSHKAIRICCSQEIEDSILSTGKVNGPVYVIPLGVDQEQPPFNSPPIEKGTDLLIIGLKQPEMAKIVYEHLHGSNIKMELLLDLLPRRDFLNKIRGTRIAVFLPNREEGVYMPALEAMALGTIVVCPDVIGNRSLCIPGVNSFRPDYNITNILEDVRFALQIPSEAQKEILLNARAMAEQHQLIDERRTFIELLMNIDQLW